MNLRSPCGWKIRRGSNNGFDHVFVGPDGTVTLLIDSKQMNDGAVRLSQNAAGNFIQMSDDWVRSVLDRIDKMSPAYLAVLNARRLDTLVLGIAAVDKTSGNIVVIKLKN